MGLYRWGVSGCAECGRENPQQFRFCGWCGTAVAPAGCPSCGEPYAASQRFCGGCGTSLDGSRTPARGPVVLQERRLATVLFADVVGFTSLAEQTDAELVARMVDAAFREMGKVVVAHGGTVDKYMGDSLMAVFGVPYGHDDDAERAVSAALEMVKLGGELEFSIGINSGELMATPIGEEGGLTVIGDTVNVAARLEKAAGPGEILCGPLTVELVGPRGSFRSRKPVLLKGKQKPVEVAEAVGLLPASSSDDGGLESVALVGRSDELAYLRSIWQRVSRQQLAQMVLLCGEAGSGKTRLVAELASIASADGGKLVRASHPAYGLMGGQRVIGEILSQIGPAGDEEVSARVRSLAGSSDDALRAMDPEGLFREQLWGFLRLIEEKGEDRPILVVIDDVHHSGETFLKLIAETATRLNDVPVLTLLVGRSEPNGWLAHFPTATTLRLGPLSQPDAIDLANAFIGEKPLSEQAARFVVERAGGNPLYSRELIRVARASGALVERDGCFELDAPAVLPASLHALLSARLDSLGPVPKSAFQIVALLGDSATQLSVEEVGSKEAGLVLQDLVDGGLLRARNPGTYEPADALLAEVAYEMLPLNVRGELHKRAAAHVVRDEEKARHLERAADYLSGDTKLVREAASYLARMGEDHADAARYSEAIRLLERAVVLGDRTPSALLRLAELLGQADRQEQATAILQMVEDDPTDPAVGLERDHTAARMKMFVDPAEAVPRLSDLAGRWAAIGDHAREAWALGNAGVASFNLNRMEESADLLERALTIFEQLGDRPGEVSVTSFLSLVRPVDPRTPHWLADALAFADDTGDRSKQMSALSALTWSNFLRSLWGDADQVADAEAYANRLAVLGEQLGADETTMQAWSLLAVMARWTGRMDEAKGIQERLAGLLARRENRDSWLGWAVGFAVAVAEGATSAAPPFPPAGNPDPVSGFASIIIRAELAFAGRLAEASVHSDTVYDPHGAVADAVGVVDGLVLVLCGRVAEARPILERAVSASRALHADPVYVIGLTLLDEIDGRPPSFPEPTEVASLVGLVQLRAHARSGSEAAVARLHREALKLAMPGLEEGILDRGGVGSAP